MERKKDFGRRIEYVEPGKVKIDLPGGSSLTIEAQYPDGIEKKTEPSLYDVNQALLVLISSTRGIITTGSGLVDQDGFYLMVEKRIVDTKKYSRDGTETDLRTAVGILASKKSKMNAKKVAENMARKTCELQERGFNEKSPEVKSMIGDLMPYVTQYFSANMTKNDARPKKR